MSKLSIGDKVQVTAIGDITALNWDTVEKCSIYTVYNHGTNMFFKGREDTLISMYTEGVREEELDDTSKTSK